MPSGHCHVGDDVDLVVEVEYALNASVLDALTSSHPLSQLVRPQSLPNYLLCHHALLKEQLESTSPTTLFNRKDDILICTFSDFSGTLLPVI
jgi:hypothetical protein